MQFSSINTIPLIPGLYLIATPIGNKRDISLRALDTLRSVDTIYCEDTRHSGKLLHHYGIKKPLKSYHDHNGHATRPTIITQLQEGQTLALMSDAGTPAIADPGYKLVKACLAEGLRVFSVPGASALLAALPAAGLPTDQFAFFGFLPPKERARAAMLEQLRLLPMTLVFYESPRRLCALLAALQKTLGDRRACVARELTKLHEDMRTAPLSTLQEYYQEKDSIKGECVVLVEGQDADTAHVDILPLVQQLVDAGLSTKDVASAVSIINGTPKKEVYALAMTVSKDASK